MRTTLDLDESVLAAARSLASVERISLGAAVSRLALRGLLTPAGSRVDVAYSPFPVLHGDPDRVVTDDVIAQHRDD